MRPKAKYAVIHRHRGEYPISVMCKFFGVSRSGYYCFKKRLGETDRDAVVAKGIVAGRDGEWIHFDYVPEETSVRNGSAGVIGRLCVIGSHINEAAIEALFA